MKKVSSWIRQSDWLYGRRVNLSYKSHPHTALTIIWIFYCKERKGAVIGRGLRERDKLNYIIPGKRKDDLFFVSRDTFVLRMNLPKRKLNSGHEIWSIQKCHVYLRPFVFNVIPINFIKPWMASYFISTFLWLKSTILKINKLKCYCNYLIDKSINE